MEDNLKKTVKHIIYKEPPAQIDTDDIEVLRDIKLRNDQIELYQSKIMHLVEQVHLKDAND